MCTIKNALVKCAIFKILVGCVSLKFEVMRLIAIVVYLQMIELNARIVDEGLVGGTSLMIQLMDEVIRASLVVA